VSSASILKVSADIIYREFVASLELLEAIEYHISTFALLNWEWLFQTVVPWLATAIVLTYLPYASRQADVDRGRKQIEIIFQRYTDPSSTISTCPRWLLLVRLRHQMSQISQWDATQRPTNRRDWNESQGVTPQPNLGVSQGMNDPALLFTDDLMLDFGTAGQMDTVLLDELGYQDMQDLPWYVIFILCSSYAIPM
jgi:hypothetical protein